YGRKSLIPERARTLMVYPAVAPGHRNAFNSGRRWHRRIPAVPLAVRARPRATPPRGDSMTRLLRLCTALLAPSALDGCGPPPPTPENPLGPGPLPEGVGKRAGPGEPRRGFTAPASAVLHAARQHGRDQRAGPQQQHARQRRARAREGPREPGGSA